MTTSLFDELEADRLSRGPVRGPAPQPISERLLAWRTISPQGCWLWQGALYPEGYGYIKVGSRRTRQHNVKVHRLAYEIWVGPIPEGMQIDHICRVRNCFNPEHLRPVTNKQNCENLAPEGRGISGVRGVHWDAKRNLWRVEVGHLGKLYGGGWYADLAEAGRAAAALRNSLHTHNTTDRTVL